MIEFHLEGGLNFMLPLTLMLLLNVGIIVSIVLAKIQKKNVTTHRNESVRQIGGLTLAWGVFSTVVGLAAAFGDISKSNDAIPFEVIMGGLRVALITAEYGLVIFIISLVAFLALRVNEAAK